MSVKTHIRQVLPGLLPPGPETRRKLAAEVINGYDDRLSRAYCHARFRIINQRFLDEMRQYLPTSGKVLELGCGFGLFALYFARSCPGLNITGIDIDQKRIRMAQSAAARLHVENVQFRSGDARELELDSDFDAVYMLDIMHHVTPEKVPPLLKQLYDHLRPGGTLLIKDVDTSPTHQMAFTWLLDVLMTRGELPHYWASSDLIEQLRAVGFQVFCHPMLDILPYPHRLYFCLKGDLTHLSGA